MLKLTQAQARALLALNEAGVAHYSNETVVRTLDVFLYWQSADALERLGLATIDGPSRTRLVRITEKGRAEARRMRREGKV